MKTGSYRHNSGLALVLLALGSLLTACATTNSYTYKAQKKPEKPLQPVETRVVSLPEAQRSKLRSERVAIAFGQDQDGAKLVSDFLELAQSRRAHYVADLAIYLQSEGDSELVECRSAIVPETVTESTWKPATTTSVPVQKPVTKTVTEQQYRCKRVSALESRPHTQHQQKCQNVQHPVQRSRTTYRSSYDSRTHSTKSTPHTEYYTDYQSRYECRSVPVTQMRMETVHKTQCGYEPVTHLVTRYEFQLDSRYVPAHFESLTRQRLKELEPQCYRLEPATSAPTPSASPAPTAVAQASTTPVTSLPATPVATRPTNRIEGWLFFE